MLAKVRGACRRAGDRIAGGAEGGEGEEVK